MNQIVNGNKEKFEQFQIKINSIISYKKETEEKISNLARMIKNLKLQYKHLENDLDIMDKKDKKGYNEYINLTNTYTRDIYKLREVKSNIESEELLVKEEFNKLYDENVTKILDTQRLLNDVNKCIDDLTYNQTLYYTELLSKGFDLRTEGLIWIVKKLLELKVKIKFNHFPQYLHHNYIEYILNRAKKEMEISFYKIILKGMKLRQKKLNEEGKDILNLDMNKVKGLNIISKFTKENSIIKKKLNSSESLNFNKKLAFKDDSKSNKIENYELDNNKNKTTVHFNKISDILTGNDNSSDSHINRNNNHNHNNYNYNSNSNTDNPREQNKMKTSVNLFQNVNSDNVFTNDEGQNKLFIKSLGNQLNIKPSFSSNKNMFKSVNLMRNIGKNKDSDQTLLLNNEDQNLNESIKNNKKQNATQNITIDKRFSNMIDKSGVNEDVEKRKKSKFSPKKIPYKANLSSEFELNSISKVSFAESPNKSIKSIKEKIELSKLDKFKTKNLDINSELSLINIQLQKMKKPDEKYSADLAKFNHWEVKDHYDFIENENLLIDVAVDKIKRKWLTIANDEGVFEIDITNDIRLAGYFDNNIKSREYFKEILSMKQTIIQFQKQLEEERLSMYKQLKSKVESAILSENIIKIIEMDLTYASIFGIRL